MDIVILAVLALLLVISLAFNAYQAGEFLVNLVAVFCLPLPGHLSSTTLVPSDFQISGETTSGLSESADSVSLGSLILLHSPEANAKLT